MAKWQTDWPGMRTVTPSCAFLVSTVSTFINESASLSHFLAFKVRLTFQEIVLNEDPVPLVHDLAPLLAGEAGDRGLVVVGGVRGGLVVRDEVEVGPPVEPVDRHRTVALPRHSAGKKEGFQIPGITQIVYCISHGFGVVG